MRDIWLTKESLAKLADEDRLKQCLVRMSGCRFVAAAQDVKHIIDALELNGDYCRDVSIYQPEAGRQFICQNTLAIVQKG
jgi:hypothetical protein